MDRPDLKIKKKGARVCLVTYNTFPLSPSLSSTGEWTRMSTRAFDGHWLRFASLRRVIHGERRAGDATYTERTRSISARECEYFCKLQTVSARYVEEKRGKRIHFSFDDHFELSRREISLSFSYAKFWYFNRGRGASYFLHVYDYVADSGFDETLTSETSE